MKKEFLGSVPTRRLLLVAFIALMACALASCGGAGKNNSSFDQTSPIVAKFAYAVNQTAKTISQFSIATDGTLSPLSIPSVPIGAGALYVGLLSRQ